MVNEAEISRQELVDYSEECIVRVPQNADWRDSFVGTTMIAARLSGNAPAKAMALYARMNALARVTREGAKGWVLDERAPDGMALVNDTMFAAAAVEPLTLDSDGEYVFDRDSFLRRVLELAASASSVQ